MIVFPEAATYWLLRKSGILCFVCLYLNQIPIGVLEEEEYIATWLID